MNFSYSSEYPLLTCSCHVSEESTPFCPITFLKIYFDFKPTSAPMFSKSSLPPRFLYQSPIFLSLIFHIGRIPLLSHFSWIITLMLSVGQYNVRILFSQCDLYQPSITSHLSGPKPVSGLQFSNIFSLGLCVVSLVRETIFHTRT